MNNRRMSIRYIPHGINTDMFFSITKNDKNNWKGLQEIKKQMFGNDNPEFVLFYNSRNIKRKMTSDVIVAFKDFLLTLGDEEAKDCYLLLHTDAVDKAGTDLPAVIDAVVPDKFRRNIMLSGEKIQPQQLNCLYNIADATILISSNEGFGLTTAESLATETPIIVNVTGGLQDQCGFKLDGEYITADDYLEIGSLHRWRKWENNERLTHGEWVKPVWPRSVNLVGSPPTPYIYDDRVDVYDVVEAIEYWYDVGDDERRRCGKKGKEWLEGAGRLNSTDMVNSFKKHIKNDLENFEPRKRFELTRIV